MSDPIPVIDPFVRACSDEKPATHNEFVSIARQLGAANSEAVDAINRQGDIVEAAKRKLKALESKQKTIAGIIKHFETINERALDDMSAHIIIHDNLEGEDS